MYTAIIIGGGPAGCQSALWLKMLGYNVLIIESLNSLGGLQSKSPYLNNWVIGMEGLTGAQVATNMQKHIENMRIPVIYNATLTKLISLDKGYEVEVNGQMINTQFIVIATGVQPKKDIFNDTNNILIGPGHKIKDFSFHNKQIAILGGGDTAAENYDFIKKSSNAVCHLYARTLKARKNLLDLIDKNDIFTGLYLVDSHKMQIEYNGQITKYDAFIIFYGWEANIPNVFYPFKNQLTNNGFIDVDKNRLTCLPHVLAIGEVTAYQHPCVITSMADGVVAAKTIAKMKEDKI